MTSSPSIDWQVAIGSLRLNNPVLTASGTFGYGLEFSELVDLSSLGGIIVKGLSLTPSRGNPPPRIVETACGMLNAIGLENVGIDRFLNEKLPLLRNIPTAVIVNIYGKEIEDYAEISRRLDAAEGVSAIEINISCPNVRAGGVAFGTDPNMAHAVVHAVRKATRLPIIAKLTPNVTDITVIARAAEDAGADAVSLINTLTGMAIDIETRRPKLANVTGGLSGPAIKPVALRMVWQTARAVSIPVIGIGGILNASDAIEFFIAGASAIEVGTANFINPKATMDILAGIEAYCHRQGIWKLSELVGSLVLPSDHPF
uniref:Dihydroorotate dehydrogenase n=1 Tax=Desulfatirhabdium butyrativorans TaxID=340467 RepID=A0A7C4MMV2_9BACT